MKLLIINNTIMKHYLLTIFGVIKCYQLPLIINWLVVEPPLWKIWVHQLGLWNSQLDGKIKAMFQTTNQILYIQHLNDLNGFDSCILMYIM